MCGRFSLHLPAKSIAEFFLTLNLKEVVPRYNIAPTQPVLAVLRAPQQPAERLAVPLYWGLIPAWARDMKIAQKLTNARCETLGEKPSFRGGYRYRRCLIPASGFYEWQRQGNAKQAIYISSALDEPLAFAGLWEHWSGPEGEEITSCTIVTTAANGVMAPIHDRMPVILRREDFDLWLDPEVQDTALLRHLLVPCPDAWLRTLAVGSYVHNFRNEGPRCLEPAAPKSGPEQLSLF